MALMGRKPFTEEFRADAIALYRSDPKLTYSQVARDLGIHAETLRQWVKAAGAAPGPDGRMPPASGPGQAGGSTAEERIARLEAEMAALRQENVGLRQDRGPGAGAGHPAEGDEVFRVGDELVGSRFQFVEDHQEDHEVTRLCSLLGVVRSSFCKWRAGAEARARREHADAVPARRIKKIHAASGAACGSPRITAELNADARAGERVNEKRVARVMRKFNIVGTHLRKKVTTTVPEPSATPVPDLFKRDFTAPAPSLKYMGDVTYLPVGDGEHLYFATVIDCFSRRVAGWSITDHMRTDLVADGAVFHSDHGTQLGLDRSSQHQLSGEIVGAR
ncbi:IS3 family transposase [Streptomyces sp. NRRL B-1347]|uniref:IS3 family transposase n=1 Tax=Streptomyces sp. NRRL B-1347 TaxID=1476877 RepID=UPI0006925D85|nr:IS3 family transposase [Streptomyces sp. NRRL B-1347]